MSVSVGEMGLREAQGGDCHCDHEEGGKRQPARLPHEMARERRGVLKGRSSAARILRSSPLD